MSRVATIFVSLLAVFLLGIFYAWPQYQRVSSLMNELQEKNIELKVKKDYFNSVKQAAEELNGYQEEIAKVDSAIPSRPFLPSLFHFVSQISSQNGLILTKVGKFSVSPAKDKPDLKEIMIEVSFSGPYPATKSFLASLEKSSRIIEVESIDFAPDKAGNEGSPFTLRLKTHSY
ncbi:MAG: hypothetical protein US98_C0009G0009 [Parcubacteria group bacterium GW2011_GWC1_38_6]|nr:MAG: hypothetical protein US98_C0009G0009 [Parcubacteria group bacterium GW2011_GWC1_38_6]